MGRLIGDGIAWFMILLPIALAAIIWGLPGILDVLGAIFQFMGDMATAAKG